MNDFDLESKLKGVCVPERPEEYWNDFPSRIRVQLRREQPQMAPRPAWRTRLMWASNFALTTAVLFICIQYHPLRSTTTAIIKQERCFHAQLARLDGGLHRLMLNTDGMGYLLMDAN
jgi:hypothetical protein